MFGSPASGSSEAPLAKIAGPPIIYQARSFDSEQRQAKDSVQRDHADGSISVFSLSTVRVHSGGSITAHVVPFAPPMRRDQAAETADAELGAYDRLMQEHLRLRAALVSDQPAATVSLSAARQLRIVESPARRQYMQCARRALGSSFGRVMAAAPTGSARQQLNEERAKFEQMPKIQTQYVSLLLRLTTLRLAPAAAGELLKPYEAQPRTTASQELLEQIRLYGRSTGVDVDLRAVHTSRVARLCRSVGVKLMTDVTNDRCAIQAIVDTRDGRPILATVNRTLDAPGSTTARRVRFTRLERSTMSSAMPANPCKPN
jgi:hypothetical protein